MSKPSPSWVATVDRFVRDRNDGFLILPIVFCLFALGLGVLFDVGTDARFNYVFTQNFESYSEYAAYRRLIHFAIGIAGFLLTAIFAKRIVRHHYLLLFLAVFMLARFDSFRQGYTWAGPIVFNKHFVALLLCLPAMARLIELLKNMKDAGRTEWGGLAVSGLGLSACAVLMIAGDPDFRPQLSVKCLI